jgi:hypothetical protein
MTRARRHLLFGLLMSTLTLAPSVVSAQTPRTTVTTPQKPWTPQPLGIYGFSVVLVTGDMQGPDAGNTVPETARRALADMRSFLPFKRYQLLDSAWILCCAVQRTGAGVSGRVRGPDDRDYTYVIEQIGFSDSKLTVHFSMREAGLAQAMELELSKMSDVGRLEHKRQLAEALTDRDQAETAMRQATQRFEVGVVSGPDKDAAVMRYERAAARVKDLEAIAAGRSAGSPEAKLMDSTFSIAPGETVVIGTSRVKGDQALIALLTAATKPGGTR